MSLWIMSKIAIFSVTLVKFELCRGNSIRLYYRSDLIDLIKWLIPLDLKTATFVLGLVKFTNCVKNCQIWQI
jgi:hypothetical protein